MAKCSGQTETTYINTVNVQDLRVELQTHGFGLLDGVGQLTVRLTTGGERDTV